MTKKLSINLKNSNGFTLVEVIVSVALVTLLFIPVTLLYGTIQNTFIHYEINTAATTNLNLAMNYVVNEIRFANSASITDSKSDEENTISIYENNGKIYKNDAEIMAHGTLTSMNLGLKVSFTSSGRNVLSVTITCYNLSSNATISTIVQKILLQNMSGTLGETTNTVVVLGIN